MRRRRVRSLLELRRLARQAGERHAALRRTRLGEIGEALEIAVGRGGQSVAGVMARLSPRERDDLLTHFPEVLARLQGAKSIEELSAFGRGLAAARRSGGWRPPLTREARVVAIAGSRARRPAPEVLRDLLAIEDAAERGLWPLLVAWMRTRRGRG